MDVKHVLLKVTPFEPVYEYEAIAYKELIEEIACQLIDEAKEGFSIDFPVKCNHRNTYGHYNWESLSIIRDWEQTVFDLKHKMQHIIEDMVYSLYLRYHETRAKLVNISVTYIHSGLIYIGSEVYPS